MRYFESGKARKFDALTDTIVRRAAKQKTLNQQGDLDRIRLRRTANGADFAVGIERVDEAAVVHRLNQVVCARKDASIQLETRKKT
jgi:hypothetical protein